MDITKTAVSVSGYVWAVNEYVSKDKKSYFSVDLLIKDHRNVVNIKLPDGYDRSKLLPSSLASFNVKISTFNNQTYITAC